MPCSGHPPAVAGHPVVGRRGTGKDKQPVPPAPEVLGGYPIPALPEEEGHGRGPDLFPRGQNDARFQNRAGSPVLSSHEGGGRGGALERAKPLAGPTQHGDRARAVLLGQIKIRKSVQGSGFSGRAPERLARPVGQENRIGLIAVGGVIVSADAPQSGAAAGKTHIGTPEISDLGTGVGAGLDQPGGPFHHGKIGVRLHLYPESQRLGGVAPKQDPVGDQEPVFQGGVGGGLAGPGCRAQVGAGALPAPLESDGDVGGVHTAPVGQHPGVDRRHVGGCGNGILSLYPGASPNQKNEHHGQSFFGPIPLEPE